MNTLIRNILFVFLSLISFTEIKSQGISDKWLMGYGPNIFTRNLLDFSSGSINISATSYPMQYKYTNSTITDSLSNLLFSTNGYYIADASGDTMLNGSGLNPSFYTDTYPDGLSIAQGNLIIPSPGSNSIYYLFHSTCDTNFQGIPTLFAFQLYMTTIDMNGNGGLGEVINKNQIILSDSLIQGRLTACKHANGRDWWVFCHKAYSNIFYSFLITPFNILGPFAQSVGSTRTNDGGQVVFSPDGSKLAYYWGPDVDLDIMDFDRCTGLLSNAVNIAINDSAANGGAAFSPNSQVLYIGSTKYVYQFDVTAANIAATKLTVAVWDSFFSPSYPFATLFGLSQLAPDGKIYIATSNGGLHMHVINDPDQLGAACDLVQHGVQIPHYYFNTFPNHPNYFLGKIPGSPCDTITGVGMDENLAIKFSLAPNPNDGNFNITYTPQKDPGEMEIYDLLGNLVYKERISQWSQFKKVDVSDLPMGVYLCRLRWDDRSVNGKFVKGK
jgi:hypothetical protein